MHRLLLGTLLLTIPLLTACEKWHFDATVLPRLLKLLALLIITLLTLLKLVKGHPSLVIFTIYSILRNRPETPTTVTYGASDVKTVSTFTVRTVEVSKILIKAKLRPPPTTDFSHSVSIHNTDRDNTVEAPVVRDSNIEGMVSLAISKL